MMKQSKQDQLAKLLKQTADAHHQAFVKTNGEDKNWPQWYARYLLEENIEKLFNSNIVKPKRR